MTLFPTKKITALPPYTPPLTGSELFESVQIGTSVQVPARAFVLPSDSLVTLSAMGGFLPGSRQLVSSPTIQVTDNGPGSTVQLEALFTGALPGNPTSLIGLTPINGVAVTWMRSDAAPALNQGIAPTWTSLHIFSATSPAISIENVSPRLQLWETDAAANNRKWWTQVQGEQLSMLAMSDDLLSGNPWVSVDRTGIVIDTVNLQATTVQVNGQNVRDAAILTSGTVATARLGSGVADATTWLRGDQTWQALPGGFTGFANPTALAGLVAVNGVATTAMRSDAAPALSQAIIPTWTGAHTFAAQATFTLTGATDSAILISSAQPQVDWNETDAAANNRRWRWGVQGEQLLGQVVNDANSSVVSWIVIDRTLNVVDTIALTSTALIWNGSPLLSAATAFANPTATIGLTAVNGVATTAMRSDAAPPLSQAIAPTWTAQHTFTQASSGVVYPIFLSSAAPGLAWNETDGAADNRLWDILANGEQLLFRVKNDAGSSSATWLAIDRTGTTLDSATFSIKAIYNSVYSTNNPQIEVSAAIPVIELTETDASANNKSWQIAANTEQFILLAANDADSVATPFLQANRTGTTIDNVILPTSTDGSLLVGTTAALGVGGVSYHFLAGSALWAIVAKTDNTTRGPYIAWNNATAGNNVFMEFSTEVVYTSRGNITYNRGAGLVAYNTTSDMRRKKNVVDAPDSGSVIDSIRIRSFDWKDSDAHLDYWVIAQELHKVLPMAVSVGDESKDWAVDPAKLVPLLTKEIQTLRKRIKALELH